MKYKIIAHKLKNTKELIMIKQETDEDGNVRYYKNGLLHREDGPAIEYVSGYKSWFFDGKLHREDGPAVTYISGSSFWYINGQFHRVDGPAVELINGYKEYWINDEELTKDQFNNPENINDILKEFDELQEKLKSLTLKLNKLII